MPYSHAHMAVNIASAGPVFHPSQTLPTPEPSGIHRLSPSKSLLSWALHWISLYLLSLIETRASFSLSLSQDVAFSLIARWTGTIVLETVEILSMSIVAVADFVSFILWSTYIRLCRHPHLGHLPHLLKIIKWLFCYLSGRFNYPSSWPNNI